MTTTDKGDGEDRKRVDEMEHWRKVTPDVTLVQSMFRNRAGGMQRDDRVTEHHALRPAGRARCVVHLERISGQTHPRLEVEFHGFRYDGVIAILLQSESMDTPHRLLGDGEVLRLLRRGCAARRRLRLVGRRTSNLDAAGARAQDNPDNTAHRESLPATKFMLVDNDTQSLLECRRVRDRREDHHGPRIGQDVRHLSRHEVCVKVEHRGIRRCTGVVELHNLDAVGQKHTDTALQRHATRRHQEVAQLEAVRAQAAEEGEKTAIHKHT